MMKIFKKNVEIVLGSQFVERAKRLHERVDLLNVDLLSSEFNEHFQAVNIKDNRDQALFCVLLLKLQHEYQVFLLDSKYHNMTPEEFDLKTYKIEHREQALSAIAEQQVVLDYFKDDLKMK